MTFVHIYIYIYISRYLAVSHVLKLVSRGISRYYSWYLAVSREEKIVCDSTETEKEIEHKSTIMEMRNIVINQERVIEELMLEKLYPKEKRMYVCIHIYIHTYT